MTCLLGLVSAFPVVSRNRRTTHYYGIQLPPSSRTALHVVADPPMKDDKQKKGGTPDDDDDRSDWIPAENGGFFPNLRARLSKLGHSTTTTAPNGGQTPESTFSSETIKPNKIIEVVDIHQYKREVADVHDQLVCVRFYAPWCKSCKAIESHFRRLPQTFQGYPIKFVECPVTKDNAYLHKGLGIPSLPFAHIYHPQAGLVEERKINKTVFEDFRKVLWTYAYGECPITFDSEGNCLPR